MGEDDFRDALDPKHWKSEHHLHTSTLDAHLSVDGELSLSGVALREGFSKSDVEALVRFLNQYAKVEPLAPYDESLESMTGQPVPIPEDEEINEDEVKPGNFLAVLEGKDEEQYPGYPTQFVNIEPLANRPFYYYRLHSKFSMSDVSITSLGLLELGDWIEKERATLEKEAERERAWKQEQEEAQPLKDPFLGTTFPPIELEGPGDDEQEQAKQPEKPEERYTCWILKQLGILTTDDFGHACCPYCHKQSGQSHEEQEHLDESQVLTYIRTPKGRIVGLCCDVYSYATVSVENIQANAWLDEAIDRFESTREEQA